MFPEAGYPGVLYEINRPLSQIDSIHIDYTARYTGAQEGERIISCDMAADGTDIVETIIKES